MNYKSFAIDLGDILKSTTGLPAINRAAHAIFDFEIIEQSLESITAERAKRTYSWIMTLDNTDKDEKEKQDLILQFTKKLVTEQSEKEIFKLLDNYHLTDNVIHKVETNTFNQRNFHPIIVGECQELFIEGKYHHTVLEAGKAYDRKVQTKSKSTKDGTNLIMDVLDGERGVLRITNYLTDTDKNIQEGIRYMSSGLIRAVRNPVAHELASQFPISKQDCLDILSSISFLLRKIDDAQYKPKPL